MTFNEDSRVKIPSILHLTRLGYTYLSLKNACWDEATNIFPDIFKTSLTKINPATEIDELDKLLKELFLLLDYDDLGHGFYNRLLEKSALLIM